MTFTQRFVAAIQDLLTSKKALTALGGLIVLAAARYNVVLTDAQVAPVIALFSSLLLGQGLQDMGKAKAQIEADNPLPSPITAGGDITIEAPSHE